MGGQEEETGVMAERTSSAAAIDSGRDAGGENTHDQDPQGSRGRDRGCAAAAEVMAELMAAAVPAPAIWPK